MKRKILLFILFLITLELSANEFTVNDERAFKMLCETTGFYELPHGNSPELFKEIKCFYYLFGKQSPELFLALFTHAKTNEGKLYALVGLYLTGDWKNYFALKQELENVSILLVSGCVVGHEKVDSILFDLEAGYLEICLFWDVDITTWEMVQFDGSREKIFPDEMR